MPKRQDPKVMTFGQHLEELRWRLIWALLGLLISFCVCYFGFRFTLFKLLWRPMEQVLTTQPVITNVTEGFMTLLKTALIAGFIAASPWVFYQLWAFVSAGLHKDERRYVYVLLPFSLANFILGVVFCYFVLMPVGLRFLMNEAARMGVQPLLSANEYFSFSLTLMLVFGLAFQLPLVIMFLIKSGLVPRTTFRRYRRQAILVLIIAAAIVTPTTDPVTELLLAGPLIGLYELGILMSRIRLGGRPPDDEPSAAPPPAE